MFLSNHTGVTSAFKVYERPIHACVGSASAGEILSGCHCCISSLYPITRV